MCSALFTTCIYLCALEHASVSIPSALNYLQKTALCVLCVLIHVGTLHLNMDKDNKDKPFKIKKNIKTNIAAKRPCPDTSASTATDTTSYDNLQELSSI